MFLNRTKQLGTVLKVVGLLLLPIPLLLWPAISAAGSILSGLGYGFGQPLVATFEAVGENRDAKFYHTFVVRVLPCVLILANLFL
jgi:hypothetical protein